MTSQRDDKDVGYGKPPASSRFKKGRSGNPKGRPRGSWNEPPYEAVLGQMVTIREEGIERQVTAAEALFIAQCQTRAGGRWLGRTDHHGGDREGSA